MSEDPAGGNAENGIYTVLVILATAMLGAATIYLAVRSQQLFGTWNPFG